MKHYTVIRFTMLGCTCAVGRLSTGSMFGARDVVNEIAEPLLHPQPPTGYVCSGCSRSYTCSEGFNTLSLTLGCSLGPALGPRCSYRSDEPTACLSSGSRAPLYSGHSRQTQNRRTEHLLARRLLWSLGLKLSTNTKTQVLAIQGPSSLCLKAHGD